MREGRRFSITRLTVLKTLCREPPDAARFVIHLAVASREQLVRGRRPRELAPDVWKRHRALADEAVAAMAEHLDGASARTRSHLADVFARVEREQDTVRPVAWGQVRVINDRPLLVIEDALRCLLWPQQAPQIAYQAARDFAEEYDPTHGTGLIPASAPFVEQIAAFWAKHHPVPAPRPPRKTAGRRSSAAAPRRETSPFATTYPAIARWVNDCGWIEIGYSEGSSAFVRALDIGGLIWEGKDTYSSVDAALAAMEKRLAKWIAENLDAR